MQIPAPTTLGWQRLVLRLAASRQVSALLSPALPLLDRALLRLSGGKRTLTGVLTGLPIVWLTSCGAASGLPRSCPLVGIPDGERLVLIASNFGGQRHPSWYHNLQKNPDSQVSFNGGTAAYRAYEANGSERERLWDRALQFYPGFNAYAFRAGARRIPVMVLEPERPFDDKNEREDRPFHKGAHAV